MRDIIDFFNYLLKIVLESIILVFFDVISLYININYEFGIKVMKYWINKYLGSFNLCFSKEFIIDLIFLILMNNIFIFDDRIFF